jgi:hypothetical protein
MAKLALEPADPNPDEETKTFRFETDKPWSEVRLHGNGGHITAGPQDTYSPCRQLFMNPYLPHFVAVPSVLMSLSFFSASARFPLDSSVPAPFCLGWFANSSDTCRSASFLASSFRLIDTPVLAEMDRLGSRLSSTNLGLSICTFDCAAASTFGSQEEGR